MKSAPASADCSKRNLLDFDRKAMEALFGMMGEQSFRTSQILKWIYQKGEIDFNAMTDLSKSLRSSLDSQCDILLPRIVWEQQSVDGTRKWALEMGCGNQVETVFIPEQKRGTLCVSSQVGCALACTFCSTGQQGFNRNLSVAEIIGQLWIATQCLGDDVSITNVVMMGMGEPLLNFNNVVSAMNLMMDDHAYGLSKRRVTLSTSGIVPAIDKLREVSDVSLAVSLHAPNDELRNELVPINKKYPIRELLKACKRYASAEARRKVTFEYVMLKDTNDSPAHAKALCTLLSQVPSKVNLIPFNPFPNTHHTCSTTDAIDRFRDILHAAGLVTTTRKTRGDDIDAACGQLVGRVKKRKSSQRHELHVA